MGAGRPEEAPPRNRGGGGGGGPVARGGGERVGEHQRSVRELAVGFFGREGGWRRGLRGSLGGGGANGGRRQLWTPCGARSGARSREERRIRTSGSSWNGLGGPGRERGRARSAGAIRRRRGTSTAVLGVRARDGAAWRCREASGKHQRRGEGWGAARGRRRGDGVRRRTASLQEQRREMERGQNRK